MGTAAPSTSDLLSQLRAAEDFETAGIAVLKDVLSTVQSAIEGSAYRKARLLRGMIHLRPKEGYAGLWVLEADASQLSEPKEEPGLLPSATVWRWVEAGRQPVAVDVNLGLIKPQAAEAEVVRFGPPDSGISDGSRLRLLDRGATHIYVLPLHVPGGLAGMLSIEVECPAAMGKPFVWATCAEELDRTAWLAGPYLLGLPPSQTTSEPVGDPLLPVVGPTMASIVSVLRVFAHEEETLLIRGETGTGKSRIARWCHAQSPRGKGPFEVLDLQTVPEETQTGELFGWKKGAFTGAASDHDGYVARAEGGTLFIDEIDKLSMRAQAALLFLLEERRYRILGDGTERRADVRFVVGTNANLQELVQQGTFREDLYYRINVLPMHLPPLRERLDEVADWARYMLERRHTAKSGTGSVGLSDSAAVLLRQRSWPGNLRELDNMMRRAYTLAGLHGDAPGIVVDVNHLQMAEALEGGAHAPSSPLGQLQAALGGLVSELMAAESPVDLSSVELAGALYGLALAEAVHLTGDRDEAFRLLGRGDLVKNRNHHRVLKREWGRTKELYEQLGAPIPASLLDLMAG